LVIRSSYIAEPAMSHQAGFAGLLDMTEQSRGM